MAKYPIRFELPKAKPMKAPKPVQPRAPAPVTQRDLDRHARMQGEEARGEALMMKRKPQVIRTTVNERPTPMKKGR